MDSDQYHVTVVFDLPCESEYTFTMYTNPDSLIEYPSVFILQLLCIVRIRQMKQET